MPYNVNFSCSGTYGLQAVAWLQFITTLTDNIEALSGSPVQVTIDSISPGSVKIASTVVFLNGDATSASTYQTALTSGDTASVFGTSFGGISVDTSSIKAVTVSNPSKLGCLHGSAAVAFVTHTGWHSSSCA